MRMRYAVRVGHLHGFSMKVNLDQRVSHEMSEAAAVEVAVRAGVALGVVDLRELQTSILVKVLPMKILMGAEDLKIRRRTI